MSLSIGSKCPDFSLLNQHGELISVADLLIKDYLVVFFYPKNDTKVCTKQACGFRDLKQELSELNATVVGISSDDVPSHVNFSSYYNLNYNILSDKYRRVKKIFKIYPFPFNFIPARETFIFDKSGILISKYANLFDADSHIDFVKQTLSNYKS